MTEPGRPVQAASFPRRPPCRNRLFVVPPSFGFRLSLRVGPPEGGSCELNLVQPNWRNIDPQREFVTKENVLSFAQQKTGPAFLRTRLRNSAENALAFSRLQCC